MTFEQQKNTKALSITIGIHLLLLLFFLFFKYTMPAQVPIEEMGIEVNLGTVEDAFGDDQPLATGDPADREAAVAYRTEVPTSEQFLKDMHRSENSDAPAITTPKRTEKANDKKTPKANANVAAAKPREAKYQYPGSAGRGGNSAQENVAGGNEGIGRGEGDMGVPGGTPGASNYSGTPGSGNMSYSLNNRRLVARPDPDAAFRQGGRVVINVTVNPEGTIIRYNIRSAPNSELRRIAEQKLKSIKFNQASNAKPEEFGTITFDFK